MQTWEWLCHSLVAPDPPEYAIGRMTLLPATHMLAGGPAARI